MGVRGLSTGFRGICWCFHPFLEGCDSDLQPELSGFTVVDTSVIDTSVIDTSVIDTSDKH